MRILLVCALNPIDDSGFGKLTQRLFSTLKDLGHEIACLTCAEAAAADEVKRILENLDLFDLGVSVIPQTFLYYSKDKIKALVSKSPASVIDEKCSTFHKAVVSMSGLLKINIVHCSRIETALIFPHNFFLPVVVDYYDSSTRHRLRELKFNAIYSPLKLPKALVYLYSTWRIERDILKKFLSFGLFAVASSQDGSMLQKMCRGSNIRQLPASIELTIAKRRTPSLHQKSLCFYGYMSGAWNLDAFWKLVRYIVPRVHKTYPGVTLRLTGISIPREVINAAKKITWLDVHPTVEDICSFVQESTVCCFPYYLGSGIKTKVLECMAWGVPVITTSSGAEALTYSQRRGLLISDDFDDLAAHVVELLSDADKRERLSAINQTIAKDEFSPELQARSYLRAYTDIQGTPVSCR